MCLCCSRGCCLPCSATLETARLTLDEERRPSFVRWGAGSWFLRWPQRCSSQVVAAGPFDWPPWALDDTWTWCLPSSHLEQCRWYSLLSCLSCAFDNQWILPFLLQRRSCEGSAHNGRKWICFRAELKVLDRPHQDNGHQIRWCSEALRSSLLALQLPLKSSGSFRIRDCQNLYACSPCQVLKSLSSLHVNHERSSAGCGRDCHWIVSAACTLWSSSSAYVMQAPSKDCRVEEDLSKPLFSCTRATALS